MELKSSYPVRILGTGDKTVYLTEEEREANMHIIGEPRQGKSSFIEYLIREDIKRGTGVCLIDPTNGGQTAYNVLKFCADIGHQKVVLIDPQTLLLGKVACLQPLNPKRLKSSVEGVMELVNILFDTKRDTNTPRIKRYLSALLRVLMKNNATLYETRYFSKYQSPRDLPYLGDDIDSQAIEQAFRSAFTFERVFESTINRLDVFWQEPLSLMLGADDGVDFVKLVSEGWTILVNLYPNNKYLSDTESRLLGVLVIAQINQAMDALFAAPPQNETKNVFYLYIDEAGRFATPQIDTVLTYKAKTGLRMVLAHHFFSQFQDRQVLDAVKNGARIKLMFNLSNPKDRMEMVRDLGYGADIPAVLASYANSNIPKQTAIIKKGKESPVRFTIPDLEPPKTTNPKEFIESLFVQPWYKSRDEINQQIKARQPKYAAAPTQTRRTQKPDTQTARPRTAPHGKTSRKGRLPYEPDNRDKWKDVPKNLPISKQYAPPDGGEGRN